MNNIINSVSSKNNLENLLKNSSDYLNLIKKNSGGNISDNSLVYNNKEKEIIFENQTDGNSRIIPERQNSRMSSLSSSLNNEDVRYFTGKTNLTTNEKNDTEPVLSENNVIITSEGNDPDKKNCVIF